MKLLNSLWMIVFLGGCWLSAAGNHTAAIKTAVDHPDRGEQDRQRDATSKPGEILLFLGVKPGMKIADLFSGEGYYSEILSHVTGSEGKVYVHNNQGYLKFLGEKAKARYQGDRLPNVVFLDTEPDDLKLPQGELDLVLMVMSYHDVYWKNPGWPVFDPPAFLGQIHKALKSGGKLAIIDHAAEAGTGTDAVQKLHRIDEAFVKEEIAKAGFILEKESDLLRNPNDDKSVLVFDPKVRRKTDRFVLLFRNP